MARTDGRRSATLGVAWVVVVLLGAAVMRGGPVSSSPGTLMLAAPTTTEFAAQLQNSGEKMPASPPHVRCPRRAHAHPRCVPHRRAELNRAPPRLAALWQRGYITDSSNRALLVRVQDGAAESGALTALAARAEAAVQEVAAQTRGGSAGAYQFIRVCRVGGLSPMQPLGRDAGGLAGRHRGGDDCQQDIRAVLHDQQAGRRDGTWALPVEKLDQGSVRRCPDADAESAYNASIAFVEYVESLTDPHEVLDQTVTEYHESKYPRIQ